MDVTIGRLEAGTRPAAARLLDDSVGAGFWSFCDGEGDVSAVALTAGRLAGVVVAELEPAGVVASAGTATDRLVLHVRAVAVAQEARRKGLGRRLLTSVESSAVARGAPAAYLFAWLPSGQPEPAALQLYMATGYAPGPDIPDFYAAGSLASGATCPYCGPPPCRCAARPYSKTLAAH
jgi:GNAT superfamily N-acetyltransferase